MSSQDIYVNVKFIERKHKVDFNAALKIIPQYRLALKKGRYMDTGLTLRKYERLCQL